MTEKQKRQYVITGYQPDEGEAGNPPTGGSNVMPTQTATRTAPWCCRRNDDGSPCDNVCEWLIVWGASPDDYTHACNEHVGDMMEVNAENHVYHIGEYKP